MTPATLISKATIRSGIRIPFRQRRVAGRFHHPCLGMARAGPSRSIGPLPGGSKFLKLISGHIPVMLATVLAARRIPVGSGLQHRIVGVTGLANPAIRGGQQAEWHPDFTTRDPTLLPAAPA